MLKSIKSTQIDEALARLGFPELSAKDISVLWLTPFEVQVRDIHIEDWLTLWEREEDASNLAPMIEAAKQLYGNVTNVASIRVQPGSYEVTLHTGLRDISGEPMTEVRVGRIVVEEN